MTCPRNLTRQVTTVSIGTRPPIAHAFPSPLLMRPLEAETPPGTRPTSLFLPWLLYIYISTAYLPSPSDFKPHTNSLPAKRLYTYTYLYVLTRTPSPMPKPQLAKL